MLPFSYNKDICYLLQIDPHLAFAYWDYSSDTWNRLWENGPLIRIILEKNDSEFRRAVIPREAKSYYFRELDPKATYQVFIELATEPEGQNVLRSNVIQLGSSHPSNDTDVRFATFRLEHSLPNPFVRPQWPKPYPSWSPEEYEHIRGDIARSRAAWLIAGAKPGQDLKPGSGISGPEAIEDFDAEWRVRLPDELTNVEEGHVSFERVENFGSQTLIERGGLVKTTSSRISSHGGLDQVSQITWTAPVQWIHKTNDEE